MAHSGVYSELKMAWWFAREGKLPDMPRQVHWVLSDLCNQDCNFCSYRMSGGQSTELFMEGSKPAAYGHGNPIRWIDTGRALRLVDEMRSLGVLTCQMTGGGEPTAHPDHERIFARTLDVGIRVSLVSNGYRWREALFPLIPRMDWVRVSVDAGFSKTYAGIRRVPERAFEKVLGNVRRAADSISAAGSPCVLGVGYTVTPDNWREIVDGVRVAKESGASNIRLSAMFGPENERPFLPIYDDIKARIGHAKALYQDATFTVYDNFGSRLADLEQHSPDYSTCPYQYYTSYIGGNVQSYRCCVLSYTRRGMVANGDLTNQRFDDFWRSEARKQDFANFDARGCPRCMFNAKNRSLLYVMGNTESDTSPRHIEWP